MPLDRPDHAAFDLQERRLRHAVPAEQPCSLLSELQSRAPLPNMFRGICRRLGVRPGVDLTLYDFVMTHGFPDGGVMAPSLTLTILLEGTGEGFLCQPGRPASDVPIRYVGGTTYFCFGDVPVVGRSRMPPDSRFRAVELRISLEFLDGIGMLEMFRAAGTAHSLCLVAAPGVWIGRSATPEPMARRAGELLGLCLRDDADDLVIDCEALALLIAGMELVKLPQEPVLPAARDLERIREAQRLVETAPGESWTIPLLARRVGLNERKLKCGFRSHLGTSVHAFVLETRLRRAYALLTAQRASVTEAALAVGYANPSHFALLFRRRYGCAPSAVAGAATGLERRLSFR